MLHGLIVGNLATWYFGPGRTLAAHHRVLLYDLRGHGRSTRPETGYDVATMADDLAGVLEALAPGQPVALVGHSYGALISLEHARRHPEQVTRLALVEAPVDPADRDELTAFLDRDPDEMMEALPDELRAVLDEGKRRARRLMDHLVGLTLETSLIEDLATPRAPKLDELGGIRCPALVVYGAHSSCRRSAERLRDALPDAELHILDGGHFLPRDAPEALTALLDGFLTNG